MKTLLSSLLFSIPLLAQPVLSPSTPPIVGVGATTHITADRVSTWALLSGSVGSLVADGNGLGAVYTAPSSVTVRHKSWGCPLGPTDSIFTTRVDNLPVHANSAAWIAWMATWSTFPLELTGSWNMNVVDNSTPLVPLNFYYPLQNNCTTAGPSDTSNPLGSNLQNIYVESGPNSKNDQDKYVLMVNKQSCQITEQYGIYNLPGIITNPVAPLCTGSSNFGYSAPSPLLPTTPVNASGNELEPLTARLEEFRAGVIKHMLRFTIANVAHSTTFVWPATATNAQGCNAGSPPPCNGVSQAPFGSILRLKSSYTIPGGVTSPYFAIWITALKQYGMLLADGGGFNVDIGADTSRDPGMFQLAYDAFAYGPAQTDFEIVDQSSLMINPGISSIKPDNAYVTPPSYAVVVATASASSSRLSIALQGVTVGTPSPLIQMQAGSPAYQMESWVMGTASQTVAWTMSPSQGSLTSGGLYTPPASIGSLTRIVLTATAAADPTATTNVDVWLYPTGIIRAVAGRTTDYTDGTSGHVYWRDVGADGGGDASSWKDFSDNPASWPVYPDVGAYKTGRTAPYGDVLFKSWILPNGMYKVTLLNAFGNTSGSLAAGQYVQSQWAKGVRATPIYDVGNAVGNQPYTPSQYVFPSVAVADNHLSFGAQTLYGTTNGSLPLSSYINGYIIERLPDANGGGTVSGGRSKAAGRYKSQ